MIFVEAECLERRSTSFSKQGYCTTVPGQATWQNNVEERELYLSSLRLTRSLRT